MKRLAWISDIHLDRLTDGDYLEFKNYLEELAPDRLVISGDIADGEKMLEYLRDFNETLKVPIYFILGNHDFYYDTFAEVTEKVRTLVKECENLNWLSECGIVRLNEKTALIGVEGWGDARCGTFDLSEVISRDLRCIKDLVALPREAIGPFLNSLGEKFAQSLRPVLLEAVKNYSQIYLVTHVPPFVETCFDRSLRICEEFKLPFYTCKAIGDLLLEVMRLNPSVNLTVLCGHTHEKCDVQILENLRVRVKDASYGSWWEAAIIKSD